MLLRPSADVLKPALLWAGGGLVAYLIFRGLMPPRPALAPLFAALGVTLAAAVLYNMRGQLFGRSGAFVLVGGAAYLFAWIRGVPAMYAFSAACFAIVAVSHLLPRWALRTVAGRIHVPPWVNQGDPAEVRVLLRNPGAAAVRMLELDVGIEGALDASTRVSALLVHLASGAERELALHTPPLRRGRHRIGPLSARTGFPLGLAFAAQAIESAGETIWVYPRLFDVGFLAVSGGQFLQMGDAISPRSAGQEEFAGVREYRHGDSRRHVHWRASARLGELVVKEFTRETAATVTIAVDLGAMAATGEGIETPAEYAIRIAASLARYVLGEGHTLQIALCGPAFDLIGPVRSMTHFEDVLRALALAKTDGDAPFASWLPQILEATPMESTAVLVCACGERDTVPGAAAFENKGVLLVPFEIDAASFATVPQAPAGTNTRRRVRKGEDLAAWFRQ